MQARAASAPLYRFSWSFLLATRRRAATRRNACRLSARGAFRALLAVPRRTRSPSTPPPHPPPPSRTRLGQAELRRLNRQLSALLPAYEQATGAPFRLRGADYLAQMEAGDVFELERQAELRNIALAQLSGLDA